MNARRFSHWARWADRNELEGLGLPGVYALAISERNLRGRPFSWIKQIVYFGMTHAFAGLKGRLKQFDNTILEKGGHGGAERFRHDYPNPKKLVPLLFVAVAPFKCDVGSYKPDDLIIMGDVAKGEWECFAKYAEAYKRGLPKYNDKKNSPKYGKTRAS